MTHIFVGIFDDVSALLEELDLMKVTRFDEGNKMHSCFTFTSKQCMHFDDQRQIFFFKQRQRQRRRQQQQQ